MMTVSSSTPNTWPSNMSLPRRMSTGKQLSTRPRNVRVPSCGFTSPEESDDNAPTCTPAHTQCTHAHKHTHTDRHVNKDKSRLQILKRWLTITQRLKTSTQTTQQDIYIHTHINTDHTTSYDHTTRYLHTQTETTQQNSLTCIYLMSHSMKTLLEHHVNVKN